MWTLQRCRTQLVGWLAGAGALGIAGAAAGQVPAGFKAPTTTLVGRVIDTAETPIADAEVVVIRQKDGVQVKTGKSNKRGVVMLRDLPAGGPYTVTARKIGYGPAEGQLQLRGGDTLHIDFELPSFAATLAPIVVTARRSRLSIAADQFDPKLYRDALSLLVDQRRDMLGDPDRCSAPPSPPWPMPVTRGIGRRPWVEASRFFDIFNPPYSPYVQRVYVNGDRIDVPGQSPLIALHEIPSDSIAEIRYVDCTDQTGAWPYSIYVVLKPPSRPVQDSIWRSIQRDSTRRDSRRP